MSKADSIAIDQSVEDKLAADICREDFFEFVKEFWDTIIEQEPAYNWHIPYMCKGLQAMAERVFAGKPKKYDVVINISPGTTKSTICSIMYPAWIWTRMPHAQLITGSYAHAIATDMSVKSRNIIESDKYRRYFPEIKLSEYQNTKHHYANTKKGWRYAAGTGGAVTGKHAHFLIIDDPINPLESASKAGLKNANEWIGKTLLSRKVSPKINVPTIMIMQRLHQEDCTDFFVNRDGAKVKHVCLPAKLPKENDKRVQVKPPSLRKRYIDGYMDPERLGQDALDEAKGDLGEYGYASQYDQTPIPEGGGMFQVDKFRYADQPLPLQEYRMIMRFWDKAASSNDGDYTAGVKMGVDVHGQYWVFHCARGQWDSFLRETKIKTYAEMDGITVYVGLEQEPGSGGKDSTLNSIKNLAGYVTRVGKPTGDKVLRADSYSVQVNAGNVILVRGPWNKEYVEELSYFPYGKHDDQVDGSSGAFSFLSRGKTRIGGVKKRK